MFRVSTLLLVFCVLMFGAQACSLQMWSKSNLHGEWNSDVMQMEKLYAKKIIVSEGCGVTVYEKANFEGRHTFFRGIILQTSSVGFNDKILSFKLHDFSKIECAVVMYSDAVFKGRAQVYIATGFPSNFLYKDPNGLYNNDYYSSLEILGYNANSCAAVAWEDNNLKGQNRYFGDVAVKHFGDFNDRISSLQIVTKSDCAVVFYNDSKFRSNARYYTTDINSLGRRNDMFSSMQLFGQQNSCYVELFKDSKMKGKTLKYVAPHDQAHFPKGWNDSISSFELRKIFRKN